LNSTGICGSSSLYAKACAKNPLSGMFLMHELGHNFGGLADEYTYSTEFGNYSIGDINAANCDVSGCLKWRNMTNGCLQGCTYSDLYRSEARNSIMYGYVPIFNLVSQVEIIRTINLILKQKAMDKSNKEQSYFINMNYDKGKIEVKEVFSKPIRAPTQVLQTDYTAEIKDSNNLVLFKSYLNVPEIIMPLPNSSSGAVREEQFEFSTILPYFQNAKILEIKRENNVVASASVASLSTTCGDKVCSEGENHLSCPEDCMIKDNFCQTSTCDPDCPSQKECEKKESFEVVAAIVAIIISLLVILIILLRSRK
jgi:hypothetical protein